MIYCSAIMCVVWCHCADFGADEYAILKGKVVEFQMTSQAVTLGRNTTSSQVDFDLSLEAPAFKISRKQVCKGVRKVEVHKTSIIAVFSI